MRAASMMLALVIPVAGMTQPAPSPVREFAVEAGHSMVGFSIDFLTGKVRGQFDDIRGTIRYDSTAPERSSVTVMIDVASIHTGSKHRDEHLRSSDFFDAQRFPKITFHSERIAKTASGLMLTGPLELHGVTKTVSIPFRQLRPMMEDPHGSDIVNFEGSIRLARKDFGILGGSKFNDWFDDLRSATMSDSVDVTLEVQGWETSFARTKQWDGALAKFAREGVAPTIARLRARNAQFPDSLRGADWEIEQIGRTLLARGKTEDGIALLKLNVELFPRLASAHIGLARGYELIGNRAAALEEARAALALDASSPRAWELTRRLAASP